LKNQYIYTGQDNLEVMQGAKNYNQYQRDFLIDEIDKIKNRGIIKVLDFGAGIGTYADLIRGKSISVECVEVDPGQAKILRQKGYKVYSELDEVHSKYDMIYSLNVLEHIKDDAIILEKLKNKLKEKGLILVYVPAFMVLFTKLDILVEHHRRYKIIDMHNLSKKSNIHLRSVKYCDPIGFFAALTYRFIGGSGNLNHNSVKIFDKYLFPLSISLEKFTKNILGKNVLAIFENRVEKKYAEDI